MNPIDIIALQAALQMQSHSAKRTRELQATQSPVGDFKTYLTDMSSPLSEEQIFHYLPKETQSFAKEYGITIVKLTFASITFVYLGKQYHANITDKSEIIHWFIKAVKESSAEVFKNCTNIYPINLGQMTEEQERRYFGKQQNWEEVVRGRSELKDWVKCVLKAKRVEQKGEYEKWQIYGIEVILFENEFSVNKINDCLNCFDYKNWEQAIEKIIEISKQLDKSSLFHRIFK